MTPVELSSPIYSDEESARKHLEGIRWPNGPTCPYCGSVDLVAPLNGNSMGAGWYYCGACKDKFTVRVGTVYERSHIPLHKWLLAFRLMASSKKGISAHQLHRTLNITYKSAWFLAHRIREAMIDTDPTPMGGTGKTIEADETLQGPSTYELVPDKGWRKKPAGQGMRKVFTLVERGGRARSLKVEDLTVQTLGKIIDKVADKASTLATDEASHYIKPGREFARHLTVNHARGEYGRSDGASTNTVEGFFSIFKRGMVGVYQHCGEQHLQRYLTEFDFRYSNRVKLGVDDSMRTELAIKGAEGKRLTYQQPRHRA